MIRLLEELSMNAWPALQTLLYDGWVLRFAEGYTRRANSVNPLYPSTRDALEKIEACERLYRGQGLAVIFKLTAASQPERLDEMLALLRQAGSLAQEGDRLIAQVHKRIAGASVPDRHTERLMRDVEEIKNRLQALPLWFREIAEYQMNANVWLLNAASVRSLSRLNVRQRIAELSTRFELYFKGYIAVCDDLSPRCEAAKGALSSIR